jgi:dsRNA-specific ribonuclease
MNNPNNQLITMDNPNNRLITIEEVNNILNYFGNIGDEGKPLCITNLDLFQRAFVHESYFQAVQNQVLTDNPSKKVYLHYVPRESNERLEYLGDHVLKSTMGRYLYQRFEDEREGFLTKLKIKIEKCSMLHKIGATLGFKKFLLLSLQVENQTILDLDRGRNTPSYYEDAFEAFIGAISEEYGEKGYIYADRFVRNVIENIIDFAELIAHNDNFKDSLQRYFQSKKWKTPVYTHLFEEGPLYRKVFTRMLTIAPQHYDELATCVQQVINRYTKLVLEHFRRTNPQVFQRLLEILDDGSYIIGVGNARKVVQAEQECAKRCLLNLNLDLNF